MIIEYFDTVREHNQNSIQHLQLDTLFTNVSTDLIQAYIHHTKPVLVVKENDIEYSLQKPDAVYYWYYYEIGEVNKIGRFHTKDSQLTVIQSILKHITSL